MTDVTDGQGQEPAGLPAADEQLLRELTERARTGGLQLTEEGGLLGRLTKMVVEGALEQVRDIGPMRATRRAAGRWMTISAMASMIRRAVMAAIPATATGPRPWSPRLGR